MEENKIKHLESLKPKLKTTFKLHNQVGGLQKGYQRVFEDISSGKNYESIDGFQSIVSRYNSVPKKKLALKKENEFEFEPMVKEADYFELRIFNPILTQLKRDLAFFLIEFLRKKNNQQLIKKCEHCFNYYIGKTLRSQKFCSDKCRLDWHNRKRIDSGEHREYKRKKRREGAKESYYG